MFAYYNNYYVVQIESVHLLSKHGLNELLSVTVLEENFDNTRERNKYIFYFYFFISILIDATSSSASSSEERDIHDSIITHFECNQQIKN